MKKTTAVAALCSALMLVFPVLALADDNAVLFETKCSACHGKDGQGNTPMAKKQNIRSLASPEVQKQTDEELFNIIANGKDGKKSHAFKTKGFTDEQIKALVSFVRSLKK